MGLDFLDIFRYKKTAVGNSSNCEANVKTFQGKISKEVRYVL
jgi:hypothetical protein